MHVHRHNLLPKQWTLRAYLLGVLLWADNVLTLSEKGSLTDYFFLFKGKKITQLLQCPPSGRRGSLRGFSMPAAFCRSPVLRAGPEGLRLMGSVGREHSDFCSDCRVF